MRGHLIWGFLLALPVGCADQIPDHIVLQPAAEDVYIATEPPGSDGYKMVGEVTGQAEAIDPDVATDAARNDLRNKAASLGAALVTIDRDTGEPVLLYGKTKVTLVGRAYKSVD
jgi:hypothetical protein